MPWSHINPGWSEECIVDKKLKARLFAPLFISLETEQMQQLCCFLLQPAFKLKLFLLPGYFQHVNSGFLLFISWWRCKTWGSKTTLALTDGAAAFPNLTGFKSRVGNAEITWVLKFRWACILEEDKIFPAIKKRVIKIRKVEDNRCCRINIHRLLLLQRRNTETVLAICCLLEKP